MDIKPYTVPVILIFLVALFLAFPRSTASIKVVSYDLYSPQARPEYLTQDDLKDFSTYLPDGAGLALFWKRAGLTLELPTDIELSEVIIDDQHLSRVQNNKAVDRELQLVPEWLAQEVEENRSRSERTHLPTYLSTLAINADYDTLRPGRYRLDISARACGDNRCMPFFVSYRFETYRYRSTSSPVLDFLGAFAGMSAL